MKNLKKDLQALNKEIKALSKKVEKMTAQAGKPEKTKPTTKAKPAKKAVLKKEKKMTSSDIVLGVIKKSKKEVTIATLKEKTGFQGQKLYNTLSILKKQGKVKNPNKGVWVEA